MLENARKQHNYHIGRLEQMLRLLDNNDLAPDQVSLQLESLHFVGMLVLILMMPSRMFLFQGHCRRHSVASRTAGVWPYLRCV